MNRRIEIDYNKREIRDYRLDGSLQITKCEYPAMESDTYIGGLVKAGLDFDLITIHEEHSYICQVRNTMLVNKEKERYLEFHNERTK